MKRILIAGGTGMIGRELCRLLRQDNVEISILSSSARHDFRQKDGSIVLKWNPADRSISGEVTGKYDAVINLAGHTINCMWTSANRLRILRSRVQSTEFLSDLILSEKIQTGAYLSSSAIGIYAHSSELKTEQHPKGHDFLAGVCISWEKASEVLHHTSARRVILRLPVVLSNTGGMLPQIMPITRLTGGFVAGTGRQHMSFVHVSDVARAFAYAVANESVNGIYNIAAPEIPTARDFAEDLAHIIGRKLIFSRTPEFLFRIFLGERSGLLLDDQQIDGSSLRSLGFRYQFPSLNEALMNLYPSKS